MSKEYLNSFNDYKNKIGISKTTKVSPEYEIGINRKADASTDMSIFTKLKPIFNVLITRDLSSQLFYNNLLKYKAKIILHVIVTGFGATPMEPYTPHPRFTFLRLNQLIRDGFPKEQIVLRIDPVIPNKMGLEAFELVLNIFQRLKIKRCRYKLFLCNDKILLRQNWQYLNIHGFPNPYYNEIENKVYKSASKYHRKLVNDIIEKYSSIYDFESCDRDDIFNTEHQLGCVSFKDLNVLGINEVDLLPNYKNKKNCLCPVNVVELIDIKTNKQCALKCLHCTKHTSVI